MGLFGILKDPLPRDDGWGGFLCYSTQLEPNSYFGKKGRFEYVQTEASTLEAMFVHAGIMQILIKEHFPDTYRKVDYEYMQHFFKYQVTLSRMSEFQRITNTPLTEQFFNKRIFFHASRCFNLLTVTGQLPFDVHWLLYSNPLCINHVNEYHDKSPKIDPMAAAELGKHMILSFHRLNGNIKEWKRKYR